MSRFVLFRACREDGRLCYQQDDERARMPAKGAILLHEVAAHLTAVDTSCNFCPRRGKASIGRLMQEHGPDMPVPELLRLLSADCPRRLPARIAEPCGVSLPQLADVFGKGSPRPS
jgi:hypothetical protein